MTEPSASTPQRRFADRRDAGRRLGERLLEASYERPAVLGMPRGGVPVAAEVAAALHAPLDVVVVRKLGAPQNEEFAIGALAEGGVEVISERAVGSLGLSDATVGALLARAGRELRAATRRYRGGRPPVELRGTTAILVDDGLATGRSAQAGLLSLRARGSERVVLAVPVAAQQSLRALRALADDIVCLAAPPDMWAVGLWYEDFRPVSDEQVTALLAAAGSMPAPPPAG